MRIAGASPGARPRTVPNRSRRASNPSSASRARSHSRASRSAGVSAGRCTPVPQLPMFRSASSVATSLVGLISIITLRSKMNRVAADFEHRSDPGRNGPGFDPLCGPKVLDRNADRLVVGDLLRSLAPGALPGDDLGDLGHIAVVQDAFAERDLEVPGMLEAVGAAIDDAFASAPNRLAVDLAGIRTVGSDRRDEDPLPQRGAGEHGFGRRRGAYDNVRFGEGCRYIVR